MASILVIDDDLDLAHFLRTSLAQQGHQVTCLELAEQAPAVLSAAAFDLIVLDDRMPRGMRGIDLLEMLHAQGSRVPVIFLSSYFTADITDLARQRGAFDCLAKPPDFDQLLRELEPRIGKALSVERGK